MPPVLGVRDRFVMTRQETGDWGVISLITSLYLGPLSKTLPPASPDCTVVEYRGRNRDLSLLSSPEEFHQEFPQLIQYRKNEGRGGIEFKLLRRLIREKLTKDFFLK